jgi:predicted HicB family RNase H-like nuclease
MKEGYKSMEEEKKKRKSIYNQKKNEYTQEYIRNNYRQLSIRIREDQEPNRDQIARAAAAAGESVNEYIMEAVRQRMKTGL